MKNTTPSLLLPPPLVLVLLLVLSHIPGGILGPTLGPPLKCSYGNIILGNEDVAILPTPSPREEQLLYVHPEPGFKGISLVVRSGSGGDGDGEMNIAWFPLEKACFQDSAYWWELRVDAHIREINYFEKEISFSVTTGQCSMRCFRHSNHGRSVVSLQVNGHGSSRWRFNRPDFDTKCTVISWREWPNHLLFPRQKSPPDICTEPPARSPQNNILVVVVAAVGMLMLVMVVIVMATCVYRRKAAATTASPAVTCPEARNHAPGEGTSTSELYDDGLYVDVLDTRAPNQEPAAGPGAPLGHENYLYDDMVNSHEDVEPIYDSIEEGNIYLTPLSPESGVPSVWEG